MLDFTLGFCAKQILLSKINDLGIAFSSELTEIIKYR